MRKAANARAGGARPRAPLRGTERLLRGGVEPGGARECHRGGDVERVPVALANLEKGRGAGGARGGCQLDRVVGDEAASIPVSEREEARRDEQGRERESDGDAPAARPAA